MANLLVVGLGPLLDQNVRRFGGQCLRTWHFTKPLLDDGHSVRLVTLPLYDPDDPNMENAALVRRAYRDFEYQAFSNCDFDFIHRTLTELARSFAPDAIVGVNHLASWVAARLPLAVPLWADLNGYEMAEKQGQAACLGDDSVLAEAWRKESLIARRADKLSTVSRPQLHALLGEMAGLGRLNRHTFHYHFAHHIPNAAHPAFYELTPYSTPAPETSADAGGETISTPFLRGRVVPEDAFVLLWSGGYNYWTDPDFLFEFLDIALDANPALHFVSTGGAIAGYNEQTYRQFEAHVRTSPNRDRYHLLGWLTGDELLAVYREADLGLNIDEPNYETFFGARNRINNFMAAGLPVLTTYGSEISLLLDEAECGVVCFSHDADELAEMVLSLSRDLPYCRTLGQAARRYAREHFAPETLTQPLRNWAREPQLAPDNAEKLRQNPRTFDLRSVTLNPLDTTAALIETEDIPALRQAQIDLDAIRGKAWYRLLRPFARVLGLSGSRTPSSSTEHRG
jgi:glycosyltransferase involved in cell wall biosynthesis